MIINFDDAAVTITLRREFIDEVVRQAKIFGRAVRKIDEYRDFRNRPFDMQQLIDFDAAYFARETALLRIAVLVADNIIKSLDAAKKKC